MNEIKIDCDYCSPPRTLFRSAPSEGQAPEQWASNWKAVAPKFSGVGCGDCVGRYQLEDDGVDVGSGGSVQKKNVSQPQIDSINTSTGPRTGGTSLFITGAALEVGALTVKFGDEPCATVDSRTATSARVVTPPATYTLNVAERCHKLSLTITAGSLAVDEAITTDAGSTGTIRLIEESAYWVYFASLNETLEAMVGTNLTGGGSGGVATVDVVEDPDFAVGETISGLSSAMSGTVRNDSPLRVYAPSGGFSPDELVRGAASNALAKLTSSPAYSGLVDVTIENEHGQLLTGGSLSGAFTYA